MSQSLFMFHRVGFEADHTDYLDSDHNSTINILTYDHTLITNQNRAKILVLCFAQFRFVFDCIFGSGLERCKKQSFLVRHQGNLRYGSHFLFPGESFEIFSFKFFYFKWRSEF